MRGVAPELAGVAAVLGISLIAPWDPDQSGGGGFYLALAVACATAGYAGRRTHWGGALLWGGAVGITAVLLYILGSTMVYELGWREASWDDFGDQDHSLAVILLLVVINSVVFGIPGAAVGAALAATGHLGARLARRKVLL